MKTAYAVILGALLCCFVAVPARAQMQCTECDPYNSSCDEPCWYCTLPSIDNGYCDQNNVVQSTCGDQGLGNPGCVQENCTSNWVVTSEENRGTYGQPENTYHWNPNYIMYACSHHRVDWVTEEDTNQCNQNSGYWTRNDCIEYVDAWKGPSTSAQDCCNEHDIYFNPDMTFSCNHYHACY
jgi:hypothetical protein